MNQRNEMAEFYDSMCAVYVQSWQAAHWNSREAQQRNFDLLVKMAPIGPDHSILDVGCGQGDMLGFLRASGLSARYVGMDVSERMIALAQRFPNEHFLCADFLDESVAEEFDWVLAVGTFNHRIAGEDQEIYLQRALAKMYRLARRGAGALLLCGYDPHRRADSYLYGYDPAAVLRMCLELTPAVAVDHAASPSSFAVFLYHNH
jgi:cyclopropane fatty-acyl-phospholipid synthase-like methyltransferase